MNLSTRRILLYGASGLLLLAALLGWLLPGLGGPKDWKDAFSRRDQQPYGTYLLYENLSALFPQGEVSEVKQNLFDQLVFTYPEQTAYLFINETLPLTPEEADELYEFVERGNIALLALREFPGLLERALRIETATSAVAQRDSLQLHWEGPGPAGKVFHFPRYKMPTYLRTYDPGRSTVLARTAQGEVRGLKVAAGEGFFLLVTEPRMLSNYYLRHPENHAFIAAVLSQIPSSYHIFWDEYYKVAQMRRRASKGEAGEENTADKLGFIMQHESLRWAFWLLLIGLGLYLLFAAKRQRSVVPVQPPLPNTTLEFTTTVGRLYFQQKDHRHIAAKKARFWLAYVHEHYYLTTDSLDEGFMHSLSAKSGLSLAKIRELCHDVNRVHTQPTWTEAELIAFAGRLEQFYAKGAR